MQRKYIVLFAALLLALLLPTPALADSFVVNSTDDVDDGICDSNHCSLREAINAANHYPGEDTGSFTGLDASGGEITIQLLTPFPPKLLTPSTLTCCTLGFANGLLRR